MMMMRMRTPAMLALVMIVPPMTVQGLAPPRPSTTARPVGFPANLFTQSRLADPLASFRSPRYSPPEEEPTAEPWWRNVLSQVENVNVDVDSIRANVMSGEMGSRGEVWFAAQAAVLLTIALGGLPFVGDALLAISGPLALAGGLAISIFSALEMKTALSPWPVPAEESQEGLITTGLFAQVRHPTYAGLLLACAGLSLWTGSVSRLVLTAVLWYIFELKTQVEEAALVDKFGQSYRQYQRDVPGKFFPQALLEKLPWSAPVNTSNKKE